MIKKGLINIRGFYDKQNKQKILPAICLVVSGGHSQLILMKKIGKYAIIGETRDDAAGECFDKTARILGLPYPGGPAIAKQAEQITGSHLAMSKLNLKLPRPMLNSPDYDFSFSGLKTAVLYDYKKRPSKTTSSKRYIEEMSKEIQQAIIDVLIKKTIKAAKNYKAKSIILGGGVCANKKLIRQLQKATIKASSTAQPKSLDLHFYVPTPAMRTDNAAMIAITASFYSKYLKIKTNARLRTKLKAKANLRIS